MSHASIKLCPSSSATHLNVHVHQNVLLYRIENVCKLIWLALRHEYSVPLLIKLLYLFDTIDSAFKSQLRFSCRVCPLCRSEQNTKIMCSYERTIFFSFLRYFVQKQFKSLHSQFASSSFFSPFSSTSPSWNTWWKAIETKYEKDAITAEERR